MDAGRRGLRLSIRIGSCILLVNMLAGGGQRSHIYRDAPQERRLSDHYTAKMIFNSVILYTRTHARRHPLRVLIVLPYAWQRVSLRTRTRPYLLFAFPLSASVRMRRWIFSNFCVRSSNVFFRHSGFTDPLRFSLCFKFSGHQGCG